MHPIYITRSIQCGGGVIGSGKLCQLPFLPRVGETISFEPSGDDRGEVVWIKHHLHAQSGANVEIHVQTTDYDRTMADFNEALRQDGWDA